MKMLVLGAGGIGGYFGGRLAESGTDVTFLVRPRRRAQLLSDGLRIVSPAGNATLKVQTVDAEGLAANPRDFDIVLLTCKSYDLDSAMDAIAPAMAAGSAVLPMLNGIAHLDRLDARFGAANVLGGSCSISVTLQPDGTITHPDPLQRLAFGERDRSQSARTQMLADSFERTNVTWEHSADIEQNMWEKISFLSVLAAVNCLFRANTGEILSAPGGRGAIDSALRTNFEIATRAGHPPRPATVEFARSQLLDSAGKRSWSMLNDVENGAPTEADHIIGWLLERAHAFDIEAPVLSLAYTNLKAYEARRAAGRLP
ncbi:MAG: ketopantoate reductase family protein [Gemmatimonadota bacterium]|nr:ketopantoate reductase family protein [Gemmatimonadota bacterium]